MHLFDVDIKDGICFKESDALSPGSALATFTVNDFKIGIGICYDIQFEELARVYRNLGKLRSEYVQLKIALEHPKFAYVTNCINKNSVIHRL